ncbi:spore coat protein [Domibacillus sp. DTU_2020_1001157_1_SI_ALB_TIR_016]|uniref:spore coat protein n=1 Tax=Domibacillus sp. DTU_2020_1001157_1_SI_ALB_TIR_016 TaxID=3077789 RepID=UPI0028E945CA|nr:spore coat protein [Domibacillus sp. DTU_2020_1001157_1_SI_ALB_TIR_016]WNS78106.1 spore coat protein [Domibacillus sp. DTU_2020_1001157_1_SI_ALB_TIR_016]
MAEKKWRALDHCDDNHNGKNGADVLQEGDQVVSNEQKSFEWIIVKDSEDVEVHTTDTQVAVSLQLGIQAAIAVVLSITVGDSDQGKSVLQDLKQFIKTKQKNTQKTVVEGSKHVKVTTTDTDLAVNIQALLQILVAIVVKLDVL